jgi:hypothetical protein
VHFTIFTPSGERFHAGELQFADDPMITERERDASALDGQFGHVRPVRQDGAVEHVDLTLRGTPRQRFTP